ncbi:MarR family transcriptional regulator [Maricaulis sp. W15]|uniref:MarR family transcriptional regulator n=1 Tax=Maricaulis maris TaxID=74318 RepID=A0A495D3Y0_9PROT|nr:MULTISPECIES: MarR family transcriptional regulator [Maricaulis]OLF75336.1 MarR family transcriptional regulator [Maricaulis sp. W15]RKQ96623.1 MarR family transcriptional regulator [Maricaulis maris]
MAHDKHDTKGFDLSDSPGHLLHRSQQFAAERFTKAMAGAKLTQRQFAVLHATAQEEGLTQTQLVKSTGIDRSTLAELVARMVKNGLLEREKLADDARANAVKLTESGRALLEAATLGAMEADKAILSALPKNKRASFIETLRRIAETLEKGEEAAKQAKLIAKEKKKKAKKKAKEKAKAKAKKAEKKGKKSKKHRADAPDTATA